MKSGSNGRPCTAAEEQFFDRDRRIRFAKKTVTATSGAGAGATALSFDPSFQKKRPGS